MSRPEAGFESIEHTADLKIRAWAPDLRGLIEQAARGMIDLMVDGNPAPQRHVQITGQGRDAEETLLDCLREIHLLAELEGLLPVTVQVQRADEHSATCLVGVVTAREDLLGEDIKAVTYHDLRIRREDGGLVVEVVFDV